MKYPYKDVYSSHDVGDAGGEFPTESLQCKYEVLHWEIGAFFERTFYNQVIRTRGEDVMAINIIEIILKNQPGQLGEVTALLEKCGIDIYCIANSGEDEYIPVSIVVSQTEKAVAELSRAKMEFDVEEGIALEIPHHPGGLNSVLRILAENGVNIISIFSAPLKHSESAVVVIRTNDTEKTEDILKKNWIKLLDMEDFSR